ncbi:hypothetical protein J6590_102859, partial [Homalodisca vitripennis]
MQPAQHVSITNSKSSPLTTRLNGRGGGLPLRRSPPLPFRWCDIRCYKTPARSLGAVRLSGISLGAVLCNDPRFVRCGFIAPNLLAPNLIPPTEKKSSFRLFQVSVSQHLSLCSKGALVGTEGMEENPTLPLTPLPTTRHYSRASSRQHKARRHEIDNCLLAQEKGPCAWRAA